MDYTEVIDCLRHFTHLRSLGVFLWQECEIFKPWESIATLISTAIPNTNLNDLHIRLLWTVMSKKEGDSIPDELESLLGNPAVLEPLLETSLKSLNTLSLSIHYHWSFEFNDKLEHLRIEISPSSVEEMLRKKLPKISKKVSLTVLVHHSIMR